MSIWLTDAVAEYVTSLGERALDRPLMSLLHSEGYHDIHLIHGPFESGKDIIAKKFVGDECIQYAIQSKAGDMGAAGWRDNRQQIELIWDSSIGHPAFDPDMRRIAVLAFNGRFKGTAAVEAQQYNEARVKRGLDGCLFWTAEDLVPRFVEMLKRSDGYGLDAMRLLEAVARLRQGELHADDIERFTRSSSEATAAESMPAAVLASLLIGSLALEAKQLHYGLAAAYGLVRLAWAGGSSEDAPVTWIREVGRSFFADIADGVETAIRSDVSPQSLIEPMTSLSPFATYPIKCSIAIETLGMFSLAPWRTVEARRESANNLAAFVEHNTGSHKPLSDRWSFSVIAPSIALHSIGREDLARQMLMDSADWLFDAIESGLGIAPRHSNPDEEISRIFGRSFDSTKLERRTSSYLATVLIDLAHALGYADLYEDLVNDLEAVRGVAEISAAPPGRDEFEQWSHEHFHFASLKYSEHFEAEGEASQHYGAEVDQSTPSSAESPWDALAIYGLFRERHTPGVIRKLVLASADLE